MKADTVLREAKRLHDLGFAIHLLHNKSKRPIESGWTSGPRKSWKAIEENYREGMNVGVRLGLPSKIKDNFLAVIDVDVKSSDERHVKEVEERLKSLTGSHTLPEVRSGRGNGSRHYYILTPTPVKPFKAVQSLEQVKVAMPSVSPSKRELTLLSEAELNAGLRLRPAWEIAFMGDGQQVVLPPSIHPDSGKPYAWTRDFAFANALDFNKSILTKSDNVDKSGKLLITSTPGPKALEGFVPEVIDLMNLKIPDNIFQMILTGDGVEDDSAMLMPICNSLYRAGLTRNQILSVLTERETYMGQAAYRHAQSSDRTRAANWLWRYTLEKVIRTNSANAMFSVPISEPVKLSEKEIARQQTLFEEFHDWRLDMDITKEDKYRATLRNVVMVLENAIGEDVVKRDLFSYRDFYSIDTPWTGKAGESIVDDDLTKIKHWISGHFGFEPNTNLIGEALTIIATRNSFDPLLDWFDTLPAWDGVERIDGWLANYFDAKGDADYLAQVFRKWLVAMIMRAYQPGAKFDWMPIFEGHQGYGKSSFGRLLCGDKYFLDWLPDLANKDSALALQGIAIVEMGELASFRKNEIETVKAFITRTVDKVRPPYGERWLEVPRRCVFFGTTNFETYLRDESGNRRFKPVKVGRLNFEALERDKVQLFAEALWLYRSGFETGRTLEISGDAKIYEAMIQSEKMVADEATLMADEIRAFIENEKKKPDAERFPFDRFETRDLFARTGVWGQGSVSASPPLKEWKFDSRNVQFAGKALRSLGSANSKSNGVRYWILTIE